MSTVAHPGQVAGRAPVAGGVVLLAVVLMAWDHLWGNQRGPGDAFPVDLSTFLITVALIAATALVVFGITVPRAVGRPATLQRSALLHGCVALALALPASWLGFPVVVAGGAIVLGLDGREGGRRSPAIIAIGLGVLVLLVAVVGTAFPAADAD